MQTPLQLDIWLQSYEGFVNTKNNIKQRNLNTVFANISKTTSPTSDSFLLIMSHIRTNIWQWSWSPAVPTETIAVFAKQRPHLFRDDLAINLVPRGQDVMDKVGQNVLCKLHLW